MSRIVGFLLLALVVWMIVTEPNAAANIVKEIAAILELAATNLLHFFTQVVS